MKTTRVVHNKPSGIHLISQTCADSLVMMRVPAGIIIACTTDGVAMASYPHARKLAAWLNARCDEREQKGKQ